MTNKQINGKFANALNINLFFETFAKVLGEQFDADIKIVNIRNKTPHELDEMPDRLFIAATPAAVDGDAVSAQVITA